MRIANHDASANVADGSASYRVHRLKCPDYGSIPNALANGPFVPSVVTFDVEWMGPATPAAWEGKNYRFSGMQTQAHIDWSATENGATWTSDPGGQTVESAFVGIDRNGVFR